MADTKIRVRFPGEIIEVRISKEGPTGPRPVSEICNEIRLFAASGQIRLDGSELDGLDPWTGSADGLMAVSHTYFEPFERSDHPFASRAGITSP